MRSDRSSRQAQAVQSPRASATVMLLREGRHFPEVLMVRRHAGTAFGSSYVFPGGVLDRSDQDVHERCREITAQQANESLGLRASGLDYYSAAVREVFEESGVLLARDAASRWAFTDDDPLAGRARQKLNDGTIGWQEMLGVYDLGLACGSLHYFAHWVTPRSEQKRFSTRFFAARIPDGQIATHDGAELTDSRWMTASDILREQDSGEMTLIYPTYSSLKDIAGFARVEQIIDWTRQRNASGIARIRPAIIERNGRHKLVLPGDPRYPDEHEY